MLTKEALAERRKGIGGSDAAKICSGDWYALWLEKTNRAQPEDLTWVFPVQMGIVTEPLNLLWYSHTKDHEVTRQGEVVICREEPILRCTLDGFDEVDQCIIQAKHCGQYQKIEDVRARYTPQVMHEIIVCGVTKGILSVIIGTNEPVLEQIELDEFWATDYVEKCRQFWQHVIDDRAPEQGAPLAEPPVPTTMRTVDMSGSNAWSAGAADWLANKAAAKTFKDAEKTLKELVEPDVKWAGAAGIEITRNKAGSLSIKESK